MAALLSVWMGLCSLGLSLLMVFYRPAFNDVLVLINLYFCCPGTICIAGLLLWAYRKEAAVDAGIIAQRLQAKVAIALALAASAIIYVLVASANRVIS